MTNTLSTGSIMVAEMLDGRGDLTGHRAFIRISNIESVYELKYNSAEMGAMVHTHSGENFAVARSAQEIADLMLRTAR